MPRSWYGPVGGDAPHLEDGSVGDRRSTTLWPNQRVEQRAGSAQVAPEEEVPLVEGEPLRRARRATARARPRARTSTRTPERAVVARRRHRARAGARHPLARCVTRYPPDTCRTVYEAAGLRPTRELHRRPRVAPMPDTPSSSRDMPHRRLGRSGLKVSVLSFGSWVSFGAQLDGGRGPRLPGRRLRRRRELLRQRRGLRRRRVRADHGPGPRRARLAPPPVRGVHQAVLGASTRASTCGTR